jgi:hypothetical protein
MLKDNRIYGNKERNAEIKRGFLKGSTSTNICPDRELR